MPTAQQVAGNTRKCYLAMAHTQANVLHMIRKTTTEMHANYTLEPCMLIHLSIPILNDYTIKLMLP